MHFSNVVMEKWGLHDSISWMSVHESWQTPWKEENGVQLIWWRMGGLYKVVSRNQGVLDSEWGYVWMSAHLDLRGSILALWLLCWNGQGAVLESLRWWSDVER